MARYQPPYFGAAYYPEDWPLEQIDQDIALMKDASMNVMRVGEFAWARMESEEGHYDFSWLHTVVDKLGQAGIATILGTPTATPPVWLVQRYPEVLMMRDQGDGVRAQHGGRRHACPNNPTYRAHGARIVTRMAEEFAHDPNVIGWQVDNEVFPNARGCRCPVCVNKFREWLRARYGTIETLNRTWGTNLFSLEYHSFADIPFPRADTWHHPSLLSAWMEFQSDSYIDFIAAQAAILHHLVPQPVGTDMMPTGGVNYWKMHRTLDVVQFNHYNTPANLWEAPFWMDMLRPLKERPFWNTETATCWNGSTAANGYREPGYCRANSWLPLALGGEANLYWLWRAHWSGHELMHGAVVDSCGRPLHIIDEVRAVGQGLGAAGEFLRGSKPGRSGLGLHFSGQAWWLFEFQPMVNGFQYARKLLDTVYRPLIQAQFRPDVIDPAASLDPYRLLLSPYLPALDEAGLRGRLKTWIEAGGTWVVGPLSDNRTPHAAKFTRAPFGSLEEWAGVYTKFQIPGDPRDFGLRDGEGNASQGSVWYDAFELRGAEALCSYTEGPMQGMAAVARKKLGKGQVVVLGTMLRAEALQRLLLTLAQEAGVAPTIQASPNLLAVPRSGPAGRGMVVVELENKAGMITLSEPAADLLTGQLVSGQVHVPPYGVLVLKH